MTMSFRLRAPHVMTTLFYGAAAAGDFLPLRIPVPLKVGPRVVPVLGL